MEYRKVIGEALPPVYAAGHINIDGDSFPERFLDRERGRRSVKILLEINRIFCSAPNPVKEGQKLIFMAAVNIHFFYLLFFAGAVKGS